MVDYFEERGINALEDASARRAHLESQIMRLMADFNLFEELGMPNQLAPPASKEVVNNLAEEKVTKDDGGKCDICLKEYEAEELIKIMPCKHRFHSECIHAWLSKVRSPFRFLTYYQLL
uniref:RING-type domain-containing protein n=1 Tax=Photinus pyralis TaxID=7054 RepID=A0A1Y1KAJ3_PHOPY